MEKTDILIFDVGMGQSIFIYPHSHPSYGMLIDCGNTEECEPVDFLIKKGYIAKGVLSNFTLTNYDQDHFSGLPYLRSKISIRTVSFAPNLSTSDIMNLKEKPHTDALKHMCKIKDTYIHPAQTYEPPYHKKLFYLQKEHLENYDTNNLSQVVFIEHNNSVICISGDLEEMGWKTLLEKQSEIKSWLSRTKVFLASHHGRDNGYCPDIFSYCKPECVVISDKGIIHDTQKNMSSLYGGHVTGAGVTFNGEVSNKRKVLTTRDDGHIWVQLLPGGSRIYRSFTNE